MAVGVVTDSSCDLPAATLLRLGVAAVPLLVTVEGRVYRERDLDAFQLYGWMRKGGVLPQTSPPELEDFVSVYERYLRAYDEVVSVHLSQGLSDTLLRAREAAAQLGAGDRIHFVDSGSASAGLAEVVMAASAAASAGAAADEVIAAAEGVKEALYCLFVPHSLRWLVQDGKAGRAQGLANRLRGVKPVLTFEAGELEGDKPLPRSALGESLAARLYERFGSEPIHLALGFAGDREVLEPLKRALETFLTIHRARVQLIGAAMGARLGPGTLMACAYPASTYANVDNGLEHVQAVSV